MNTSPRVARLGVTLIASLLLATIAPAWATASTTQEACVDDEGVTVVVDFTDLGGEIVVECATGDPASGRDALESAGFTISESQPGMICALDSQPDPCPATFEGVYWSYWHATQDGDWTSYMVGADSSVPEPGAFEGWRYHDGSAGPGVQPAALLEPAPTTLASPAPDALDAPDSTEDHLDSDVSTGTATEDSANSTLIFAGVGTAALVILAAIVALIASRRRRAAQDG